MTKNDTLRRTQLRAELIDYATPDEIDSLMSLADDLRAVPSTQRSTAAHQAGWQSLARRIGIQKQPVRRHRWWLFALAPALTIPLMAAVILVSQNAMPGDFFYGAKRAGESVHLVLAFSPVRKANLCSKYMKLRANELARLPLAQATSNLPEQLSIDVLNEAQEFTRLAQTAGPDKNRLLEQRKDDAAYVTFVLKHAVLAKNKTVQQTIQAMQDIANS